MSALKRKNSSASLSGSSNSASTSAAATPAKVQEFNIRVPKTRRKKHHMMRFNATLKVDFAQWRNVKLERENNMRQFRGGLQEDMPKFGAGSEYNRDKKEEARRKKFGMIAKKYRPEAQPYILKPNGKAGKKFKGIREGGVSENAAYYVFTQMPDGSIEAHPLDEWYNFQPIQRYTPLSAEEAEHEFGRRKKVLNYFSLMMRKRLKGDEEEEQDPEEVKVKRVSAESKNSKQLKISEMDEWMDSDDDSDSDEEEVDKKKKKAADSDDDEDSKSKSKNSKKNKQEGAAAAKKKKRDVDVEAFEESDDGDEEGREMDYDTESSEDEPDPESKLSKDMKSVAEEEALLSSEEEDEDEKKSDESEKEDDKKKKGKNKDDNNKNKKKTNKNAKTERKDFENIFSSDSSDSEEEEEKEEDKSSSKNKKRKKSKDAVKNVPSTSKAPTNKRKMKSMPSDLTGSETSNDTASTTPPKYAKLEITTPPPLHPTLAGGFNANTPKDESGITEEILRRYLMRKPMTATELLAKFRNKKTGLESDRLVDTMTALLKRINPTKQTIQGKLYMSLNK